MRRPVTHTVNVEKYLVNIGNLQEITNDKSNQVFCQNCSIMNTFFMNRIAMMIDFISTSRFGRELIILHF